MKKKFQTVYILEVITDRCLRKVGSWRGIAEVFLHICDDRRDVETISREEFFLFYKLNIEKVREELTKQHPLLSTAREESLKLADILVREEWLGWADEKILLLGTELSLSPGKMKVAKVKKLPSQNPDLN